MRVGLAVADVLYAYSDPLVAASRRRGPGITVIDGDSFTDLCTLPMDTPVAGLAVDHRDKCFAVVDIHSGCGRLFEVWMCVRTRAVVDCMRCGCVRTRAVVDYLRCGCVGAVVDCLRCVCTCCD